MTALSILGMIHHRLWSFMIYISSYWWMIAKVEALAPKFVVSIMDPGAMVRTPHCVAQENHLALSMHDVDRPEPYKLPPSDTQISRLLEFGSSWSPYSSVLIHCMAGVSRSPAAALVLLAMKNPGRELDAARALSLAAPHAAPNSLLISIADKLLGLENRLVRALRSMPTQKMSPPGGMVEISPFL